MPRKSRKKRGPGPSLTEKLTSGILQYFRKNPDKQFNYKQIAAVLAVTDSGTRKLILSILDDLVKAGYLSSAERGKFQFKQTQRVLQGKIQFTKSRSAFVSIEKMEKDVFIPSNATHNSFDGDTVEIKLQNKAKRGKPEGRVVNVIERATDVYGGLIDINGRHSFFIPDNKRISVDFYIPEGELNGAENGQKVLVELLRWNAGKDKPECRVTEILGYPGENNAEIHSILAEYGLPYPFEDEVDNYANSIPEEITEEEIEKRRDFREITTFTIDPVDAKDFDDALSFRKLENGNTEIGVHIADVSHYMHPFDPLDKEAIKRGNSVYLVDRVVPMLPERLSNFLCSLRPNEDKLCFSAVFEFSPRKALKSTWFGRTIIHSDRRFTYEEAQEIIETKKGDFSDEVLAMDALAKKLREQRIANGAIEFGGSEVRFQLDEDGEPIGVTEKVSKDANKLIEEFMLLANRKVAEIFSKPKPAKPFVYRVHDLPDPEKIRSLKVYLMNFGYKLEHKEGKAAAMALNNLLKEIEGKPEEGIIKQLAVRSMAKAEYTTENIGHYGLAFEHYTHFTSPIRRYPDVMVHRILQLHLDGKKFNDQSALEGICKANSASERKAVEAERASIKYMQVKYLQKHIGDEFEGVISGLTGWGIYVELKGNKCEGMISLNDLTDDDYVFDERRYVTRGLLSDNEFHLGQSLKVRVRNAHMNERTIDLDFVELV